MRSYLGLGSNLGNREEIINTAIVNLGAISAIKVITVSSIYESSAVGYNSFNSFLNLVIEINTNLSPIELLKICLELENRAGRERTLAEYQDRYLDIDIILYGELKISTSQLELPHPEYLKRLFVLIPLCEINKDLVDSSSKQKLLYIRDKLIDSDKKQKINIYEQ